MKLRYGFVQITILLILLVTLSVTAPARAAGRCYVNDDASGTNDGTSWSNAYTSLQSALADSCTEIWVAAGTYKPHTSDRTASFVLEDGTAIYGGFDGTETLLTQRNWKTNVTTLSGDLAGDDSGINDGSNGSFSENAYHVVFGPDTLSNSAVLDGFTITGGYANFPSGNPTYYDNGGGMYNQNSSPMLANLVFRNNYAYSGGGLNIYYVGAPTLTNITFDGNYANNGGGLYINTSNSTLTNVTFSNNHAAQYGGGIYTFYRAPVLTNVTFSGNTAGADGGGLYNISNSGNNPTLTNVTFSGNAANLGGGLYNSDTFSGTVLLKNVIIANSTSGGDCVLTSGTLDGASSNNLIEDAADACGLTDGVNSNIVGSDPKLGALADNGGSTQTFALQTGSPAVNAGTNTGCPADDQRGVSRPQNSVCEIGAYEAMLQSGATRIVTKLVDTNDLCEVSNCSLRAAIASAASGNTITFDSSLSGGIIYLNATLNITTNMTIDGSALTSKLTISGDSDQDTYGNVGVFWVNTGATVTLSSLIITKGWRNDNGGAGVYNNGTLTIINSIFSANTVDNQSGGAILNDGNGSLSITGSTFSNNSAYDGGAIANYNQFTLANSTFTNNGSGLTDAGGAIYTTGASGTLTESITNSTFSGNSANTGSAVWSSRTHSITNSTFSGNTANYVGGSSIWQDGETLNYANNIVVDSVNGGCKTINAIGIHVNNLVEDDINCSATISGDPLLGSLANNGGPTQTFSLLPGSIAINKGDDATCAAAPVSGLDQRGVARPNGDHCDLGAYEHQDTGAPSVTAFTASNTTSYDVPITAFTETDDGLITAYMITESATPPAINNLGWEAVRPTTYTTLNTGSLTLYPWVKDDAGNVSPAYGSPQTVTVCIASATVTSTANAGAGTLRQAIYEACNSSATIDFALGLSGATIHLASTLTLSKDVTIDGSSLTSQITISGDSDSNTVGDVRVLSVDPGVTATLDSLTIAQGYANEAGAIFTEGNLTITNSNISYNTSTGYAGAITNSSSLTITDSTFYANTATGFNQGAGAILNNGDMTISGSTFSGNTATIGSSSGGAIYNIDPDTTISNSTFSGNAAGTGGGIYTTTSMTITNSTFSDNSAANTGGIYIDGGTTNLENTIIANSTGGDCTNTTVGLGVNINNLIEDGSCYPFLSGDPNLGTLANNGGPTKTVALLADSVAINAGDDVTCYDTPVNNFDQRGTARPNGPHCDIGAYEYVDITAPGVTAFTVPSPSTSLTITINNLTASDDVAVTGFKVTTSATPPLASDTGWTSSFPSSYTVGSDGSYTLYPWAKDAIGHVSALYNAPASVTVDTTAPSVVLIALVDINPTARTSPQFSVTFSEAVSSVDVADFSLTATVTGASVSSVSGSGSNYIVTVSTGTGNGTIRLDIPNTASITDTVGNPLSGLPYTSGASYTINKTLAYTSTASQDGWILESTETSNTGGTLNTAATTFNLGDDALDKQYRAILSFNTASIPDNATISQIAIKIKRITSGFLTGNNNPFSWGSGLKVDVCQLRFGTTSSLQLSDFGYNSTTNCKLLAATFGSTPSLSWYSANLVSSAFAKLNKTGLTQFRLRFAKDDNDDGLADYLKFYSGNATAASRPQLVITYSVP